MTESHPQKCQIAFIFKKKKLNKKRSINDILAFTQRFNITAVSEKPLKFIFIFILFTKIKIEKKFFLSLRVQG